MGLSGPVLSGVSRMNYRLPTPIQRRTLPLTLGGRDVVAMARTGSGKTAAFLIPILERLQTHSTSASGPRAIVLAPTRELAQQTLRFARGLGRFTDLRCALIVGGDSIDDQFEALSTNPDIVIATPGRLMHLLAEVRDMTLARVELLVFDEADRLFELGFAEQLEQILRKCPEQRQTMLFSATLPKMLVQFARAGLRDPELLRLDLDTKVSEKLKLAFFRVRTEEKEAALLWTLRYLLPGKQQAMVFVATRQHVELIAGMIRGIGITAEAIYGQLDPDVRRLSIQRFRTRRARVLVATDVAARGIDLPLLDNVINFNFPDRAKLFVHRCGRVARQGRTGCAVSIVSPQEVPYMADVFAFLDRPLAASREQSRAEEQAKEEDLSNGFGDTLTVTHKAAATPASTAATPASTAATPASSSTSSSASSSSASSSSAAAAAGREASLSLVFDRKSSEPAHVAAAEAAASALRNRYTIATMEPTDVHHGRIPRAQLQPEIEAIAKWEESGGGHEPKALRRAAVNGAMQYEKSRKEASRSGVGVAKRLSRDASIHPLALGDDDVTATVAQEAAAATISAYRPHQTVFELEGGRKAHTKRQQAAASMKLLRAVHRGKVNKDAAAIREADKAVAAAFGLAASSAAAAATAAVLDGGDGDSQAPAEEALLEALDGPLIAQAPSGRAPKRERGKVGSDLGMTTELMAVRAMAGEMGAEVTALPARGGPRMSVAERKRQKAAALSAKSGRAPAAAASSSSGAGAGGAQSTGSAEAAHSSRQIKRRSARATAELAAMAGASSAGLESWARKSTTSTTGVYRDPSLYVPGTASDAARATEAALGVNAGVGAASSSVASAAARANSSMIGAAALEANSLDMMGDDTRAMGKKRLQSHWDPHKKRFVKLSDQDWAERRGEKRLKLANGEIVRGDGREHGEMYRRWAKKSRKRVGTSEDGAASSGGVSAAGAPLVLSKADYRGGGRVRQHALAVSLGATSAQTKGAAVEETARLVADARGEDYDDRAAAGEDDTKTLIKAGKKLSSSGKGVRRELRTETEIRKLRKQKADNKLRNMPKDKRRVIVGKERSDILKKRAKRHTATAGQGKSFKIVRKN